MTGPTEDTQDWTDFLERLEASADLQHYILRHQHGTPWPDLERAQFLCRSIVARSAAMAALV